MNRQKGFSSVAMVGILTLIVVVGGILFFLFRSEDATQTEQITPTQTAQMAQTSQIDTNSQSQGNRLAGDSAPLLDFTKADYDKALETDKLVVLYFYANWCPICREEFPKMQAAFDELSTDQVIGFRVSYSDSETDDHERTLASQFGVAYQHTKVFIQNKKQVFKSPESWEKSRYQEEINKFIN